MTTTLSPDRATAWMFGLAAGKMPDISETERGTWEVKGLKVFKAATFKDSLGRQKKWTGDDLDTIAANFTKLRADGLLVDIPVRADHSISVDNVKGYFTNLYRKGDFLEADVEFTEPDGAEKYRRGTYRSRSIEIGAYETNGEEPESFYPVALGLAFVDIGAVEGLYRTHNSKEESPVPEAATFRIRGVETTNTDQVQSHIDELEKPREDKKHSFRVAGADESDFAKVQSHIESLETFKAEQLDAGRDAFVDKLATDKKVAQPQVDGLKTFAKTLTSEQYDAWKTQMEAAPALFGKVAGDGNGTGQNEAGGNKTPEQEAIDTHLEVVRMHRRSGMAETQLRATDSFRKYVAQTGNEPV